ncbi:MAG: hypothetical protein B6241_09345 [Spirochaetaceae bacterium 4572_59]|nr:MAG: hypothetical protein B6241_09345 [Spirochaetaceae bacterium 4572_59]
MCKFICFPPENHLKITIHYSCLDSAGRKQFLQGIKTSLFYQIYNRFSYINSLYRMSAATVSNNTSLVIIFILFSR